MASERTYGLDFGTSTILLSAQSPKDDSSTETLIFKDAPEGSSQYVLPSRVGIYEGKIVAGFEANELLRSRKILSESPKEKMYALGAELENQKGVTWKTLGALEIAPGFSLSEALEAVFSTVVRAKYAKDSPNFETDIFTLGCPSSWNEMQRTLLIKSANNAGIKHVRIDNMLEEPVAAGLSIFRERSEQGLSKVLVVDSGGGTTDVALIEVSDESINVLCSDSTPLAGNASDKLIQTAIEREFASADKAFSNEALSEKKIKDIGFSEWLRYISEDAKIAASDGKGISDFFPSAYNDIFSSELRSKFKLSAESVLEAYAPVVRGILECIDGVLDHSSFLTIGDSELRGLGVEFYDSSRASKYEPLEFGWSQDDLSPEVVAMELDLSKVESLQKTLRESIDVVILTGGLSASPALKAEIKKRFPSADFVWDAKTSQTMVVNGLGTRFRPDTSDTFRIPYSLVLCWKEQTDSKIIDRQVTLVEAYSKGEYDLIPNSHTQMSHFGEYVEIRIKPGVRVVPGSSELQLLRSDKSKAKFEISLRGRNETQVVTEIGVGLNSREAFRFKRYLTGAWGIRDSNGSVGIAKPKATFKGAVDFRLATGDRSLVWPLAKSD